MKESELGLSSVRDELGMMSEKTKFTARPGRTNFFLSFLKRYRFFRELFINVDDTGDAVIGVLDSDKLSHLDALTSAGQGLHVLSTGFVALDLLRIPLVTAIALISGEKNPIKLTRLAKWTYSAILVALGVTALLLPPAAPFILIGSTAVILTGSLVSLGFAIAERIYQTRQLRRLERDIVEFESGPDKFKFRELKARAAKLKDKLSSQEKLSPEDVCEFQMLETEFERIQTMYDRYEELSHETQFKFALKLADRGVALVLSALALVGLVVSVFFPVVGLSLLAGVAATGGLYFLGRIIIPLAYQSGKWLAKKLVGEAKPETLEEDEDLLPEEPVKLPPLTSEAIEILKFRAAQAAERARQESAQQSVPGEEGDAIVPPKSAQNFEQEAASSPSPHPADDSTEPLPGEEGEEGDDSETESGGKGVHSSPF